MSVSMVWSRYDEAYDKGLAKIRCIYCSLAQSRNIPETIYELCLNLLVLIMLIVVIIFGTNQRLHATFWICPNIEHLDEAYTKSLLKHMRKIFHQKY